MQGRAAGKRSGPVVSLSKQSKHDLAKDDGKSVKTVARISSSSGDRDSSMHSSAGGNANASSVISGNVTIASNANKGSSSTRSSDYGNELRAETANVKLSDSKISASKEESSEALDVVKSSRSVYSPRRDSSVGTLKSVDKLPKRASPAEEIDRLTKRRKGESDVRDLDGGEFRVSERDRSGDSRNADKHHLDLDKLGPDEHSSIRSIDKPIDRSKDKGSERHDRDNRERLERLDKSRGDETRDRSLERYARERSLERVQERGGADRNFDRLIKDERSKEDRGKSRYSETSMEKSYSDDRFHGQSLPPPPPLPPNVVPQSLTSSRRDDDVDRRFGTTRHNQRLSPRHEERERRRSEENTLLQDDAKRRREDEFRERKREERDILSIKVFLLIFNLVNLIYLFRLRKYGYCVCLDFSSDIGMSIGFED